MTLIELFLIAVGLSMDAFAVSICKGLAAQKSNRIKTGLISGLWFGGFQALMPFLGWLLGSRFTALVQNVDHWVAFILLSLIGVNMIREAREEGESCDAKAGASDTDPRAMFLLAVATSIDTGNRRDVRFSSREYPGRRFLHRSGNVRLFLRRRPDRQQIRFPLQVQGRDCRRTDTRRTRCENSGSGAFLRLNHFFI